MFGDVHAGLARCCERSERLVDVRDEDCRRRRVGLEQSPHAREPPSLGQRRRDDEGIAPLPA